MEGLFSYLVISALSLLPSSQLEKACDGPGPGVPTGPQGHIEWVVDHAPAPSAIAVDAMPVNCSAPANTPVYVLVKDANGCLAFEQPGLEGVTVTDEAGEPLPAGATPSSLLLHLDGALAAQTAARLRVIGHRGPNCSAMSLHMKVGSTSSALTEVDATGEVSLQ